MDVEVVLTANDPHLGQRGEIVKVPRGYAMNFLLPQHKALLATPQSVKAFKDEKARRAKQDAEALSTARELSKKIQSLSITIEASVGEGDKLYGAITSSHILQELVKLGITIDKKDIHLTDPIKRLGEHMVELKLHSQVSAPLKVSVTRQK